MIAKAHLQRSLFTFVLLALTVASIAHAQAPLRMIDRLHATSQSLMRAQKEAMAQSIAQGTFKRSEPLLADLPMPASDYIRRQVRFTPFPTEPSIPPSPKDGLHEKGE